MKYLVNALTREQVPTLHSAGNEDTPAVADVYDLLLKQDDKDENSVITTISAPARKVDYSKISPVVMSANAVETPNHISAREQYRTLRTKLMDTVLPNGYKVILISSATPGDGKSLTALNLALTFSGVERIRVLLIEADLYRPSLHTLLGITEESGIDGYYTDAPQKWQRSLIALADNIDCLLAPQNYSESEEFLESTAMRGMLSEMRIKYDLILIDSPPMLANADALVLVRHCDASLLVVGAESTPIKAAKQATEMMAGKLLGCILNRVRKVESNHYYQAYYKK